MTARHPSVQHIVDLLNPNPNLPAGPMSELAHLTATFRNDVLALAGDGPEMSAGMRKLLEAKDCFVRQALIDKGADPAVRNFGGQTVRVLGDPTDTARQLDEREDRGDQKHPINRPSL